MNPTNILMIAFAGCLGGLIGGGHGALLALTIVLGISVVVTNVANHQLRKAAAADLERLQGQGGAEWAPPTGDTA